MVNFPKDELDNYKYLKSEVEALCRNFITDQVKNTETRAISLSLDDDGNELKFGDGNGTYVNCYDTLYMVRIVALDKENEVGLYVVDEHGKGDLLLLDELSTDDVIEVANALHYLN